eukprot:3670157-Pleurochrysis_carterae.AAC.1
MLPLSGGSDRPAIPFAATALNSDAQNQQANTLIQLLLVQRLRANTPPPCPPPLSAQPSFERAHSDGHARTIDHMRPGEHAHLF